MSAEDVSIPVGEETEHRNSVPGESDLNRTQGGLFIPPVPTFPQITGPQITGSPDITGSPRITALKVYNFRNLSPQLLSFPRRVTVIVGKNGQGKTSLLEAVYLLAHVRSFRVGTNRDFVQWRAPIESESKTRIPSNRNDTATVEAEIQTDIGTKKLGFEITSGRRKVLLNGKPIESARNFYGNIRIVEFSPDDLALVKGSPQDRRTLLDKILTQVDGAYVESLVQYQRALKQRNRLLHLNSGRDKVSVWDRILIQTGRELVLRRKRLLESFIPLVEQSYREILGVENEEAGVREKLTARYSSQYLSDSHEILDEAQLLQQFAENYERDARRQSTRLGPHRDDLHLLLQTTSAFRDARLIASQGQARSIALALKLAAVKAIASACGEAPILLLDDVESELDAARRRALVEIISELGSQVIITTTDSSTIAEQFSGETQFMTIAAGGLVESGEVNGPA